MKNAEDSSSYLAGCMALLFAICFACQAVYAQQGASRLLEATDGSLSPIEATDGSLTPIEATGGDLVPVDDYYRTFSVTDIELNGERFDNRTKATNLGDLVTDALVWNAISSAYADRVPVENIVGITNGGGIRATVKSGDISKDTINNVLPFGNTIAVIYLTGTQLLEALETSTYCTPDATAGFPQTAGITWTINTEKEYDPAEPYAFNGGSTTYYAPASIQRVTIESINGNEFNENAMYAVVTNNFVAAGGDTYNVFHTAYERTDEYAGFDTGVPMDNAVVAFIIEELEGHITDEKYGEPDGELTIFLPEDTRVDGSMGDHQNLAWRYYTDKKKLAVTGVISSAEPLYVAQYDENGRFLGVTVLTTSGGTVAIANTADSVKLFWLGAGSMPKCENAVIKQLH